MFISYGSQAMRALEALVSVDRGAYSLALLRIQDKLASLGDGCVDATVGFTVDDDRYVISFGASIKGVEASIAELDWQVNGV